MLSQPEPDPSLGDLLRRSTFGPFADVPVLLLAVSGGPDSMALVHLARAWAGTRARPPRLAAATVDHGLRPESAREAAEVGRWCAALGLPHRILLWQGEKPTTRIQERAREARYDLLARCAAEIGAGVVLTAHHADDQAETVLLRLTRGSGPAGLAGMAVASRRDGLVIGRPLLDLPKADLVGLCQSLGQPYVEDPSNADPRYARARLRRLSATLAAQGLDRPALLRLARRAARAEAVLAAAAADLGARVQAAGTAAPLADAADELVLRWLAGEVECRTGRRPRLDRAEAAAMRLRVALRAGAPLTISLGGLVLRLDKARNICFLTEERRRGRSREALAR